MPAALPWVLAVYGALLALAAAVADGALLASTVREAMPARERSHRALVWLRLMLQALTGGALMLAFLAGGRNPAVGLTLMLMAAISVFVTETVGVAVGTAFGSAALARLLPLVRAAEWISQPLERLGRALDVQLERAFPSPLRTAATDSESREAAAEQFRQAVEAELPMSDQARDLLLGVFDFGETTVGDVMVPRVDMVAIDRDTPWNEVLDRVRSVQHSRTPVYSESIDQIIGELYAKDLLPAVVEETEPSDGWTALIREAAFIPATKRIADQLRDFRVSRSHIAIVVDEYGGTEGMVTIEDILEELVGEIRDEYDEEERQIEEEDGTRYWVSGRVTLDELSDALGHDFSHVEVNTVGGLMYEVLGRVPRAGEQLEINGFRVIIEKVVRRKVARVFLERRYAPISPETDA